MANAVYPLWKQDLMSCVPTANLGAASLNGAGATGTMCALVNVATYTYSATHHFYSSLTGLVGTDQELTTQGSTKTFANGTLKGDNLTWTAVASGSTVSGLIIYIKNAGANSTWDLVLYLDTSQSGLPISTNGGNITVTWNASGIFTLSDEREKEDVVKVCDVGELALFEYRYKGGFARHVGLMAQDVARKRPGAVKIFEGRRHVDYRAALAA